ncbi:MAG: response regulator [Firmicutes bacterium]|nr:response regulator [Bacillota bacterium]
MARVLIVDDSAIMRRNLKTIFVQAGHTVVGEATNGGQALLMYRTHVPDLVTMDITMPNVNGIEAVRLIRKEFTDAKIIMVSALDQRKMVLEALKEGAKHYIIKPIDSASVIKVVNKVLGTCIEEPNEESNEAPDENAPEGIDDAPFVIKNSENTFHIVLSPSLNEESFASLTQAVQGLLFVKPLKVELNFGSIEMLPDPLLDKVGGMIKAIRNVEGIIRVVAPNKDFVKTVKEKRVHDLAEIIEAI